MEAVSVLSIFGPALFLPVCFCYELDNNRNEVICYELTYCNRATLYERIHKFHVPASKIRINELISKAVVYSSNPYLFFKIKPLFIFKVFYHNQKTAFIKLDNVKSHNEVGASSVLGSGPIVTSLFQSKTRGLGSKDGAFSLGSRVRPQPHLRRF